MKKIILSAAILAGLAFVSCNKDDDKDTNSNCVTCDAINMTEGGVTIELPKQTICKGENGNAFINGVDTRENYGDAIASYESLGSKCK